MCEGWCRDAMLSEDWCRDAMLSVGVVRLGVINRDVAEAELNRWRPPRPHNDGLEPAWKCPSGAPYDRY
jgi:hypothetical protein